MFTDTLGTVKGIATSLEIQDTPVFPRLRPIPYAIKDNIVVEVNRMETSGIIEKADSSEWATLIMPDIKPQGLVRIYMETLK